MPRSRRASARKSSISSPRSAGRSRVSCRRRCSAAKAIASSCSGRGVTERLAIARMGHRGDGIAETRDQAVYVPYALPGETVEVEALPQAGLKAPVGDVIDAHGEGRRRAVFHARWRGHGILEVGFAASRSHHIVDIDRCPVLSPALDGAIDAAWDLAEIVEQKGKPLDIQVMATAGGLDVDLRGSGALPAEMMMRLAQAAEAHRLARLTRHGELAAQRAVPAVRMGKAAVALPPGAFLQATAEGEASLARLLCAHAARARNIADLFC